MTVRDSAGCIVQFLYGEDGLDPTSASLLGTFAYTYMYIFDMCLLKSYFIYTSPHACRSDFIIEI
jgi:hypothetical protein